MEKTTHPDGSVTTTTRIDSAAVIAGGTVVQKVAPIFYSPRQSVIRNTTTEDTSAKTVIEVQEQPKSSWFSAGMSLLGL